MRKVQKIIVRLVAILLVALCLAGCNDSEDKTVVEEDGTINMSNLVDDVVLEYNDWGTSFYSNFQSDRFDITELFTELPKEGDTVKFYWKGKSNRDIKKLHMLVADIKDGSWTHLLKEKQRSSE